MDFKKISLGHNERDALSKQKISDPMLRDGGDDFHHPRKPTESNLSGFGESLKEGGMKIGMKIIEIGKKVIGGLRKLLGGSDTPGSQAA